MKPDWDRVGFEGEKRDPTRNHLRKLGTKKRPEVGETVKSRLKGEGPGGQDQRVSQGDASGKDFWMGARTELSVRKTSMRK